MGVHEPRVIQGHPVRGAEESFELFHSDLPLILPDLDVLLVGHLHYAQSKSLVGRGIPEEKHELFPPVGEQHQVVIPSTLEDNQVGVVRDDQFGDLTDGNLVFDEVFGARDQTQLEGTNHDIVVEVISVLFDQLNIATKEQESLFNVLVLIVALLPLSLQDRLHGCNLRNIAVVVDVQVVEIDMDVGDQS